MTVPTPDESGQPSPVGPKWRLRVIQALSIAGPGVLTVYVPVLGTSILVVATIIASWIEYSSRK